MLAAHPKASLACAASASLSELDDFSQAKARLDALNSTGKVTRLNRNTMANMAMPIQKRAGKMLMMSMPRRMTIIDSLDERLTIGTNAERRRNGP